MSDLKELKKKTLIALAFTAHLSNLIGKVSARSVVVVLHEMNVHFRFPIREIWVLNCFGVI